MLSPLLRVQHFPSRATLPNSRTHVHHMLSDHAFHSVQMTFPRKKFTTYSGSGLCFYPGTRWPQRTSQGAANALRLQRLRVASGACASLSRNCIGVSRSWTEVTKIMLDQAFVRIEFQCLLRRGQAHHSLFHDGVQRTMLFALDVEFALYFIPLHLNPLSSWEHTSYSMKFTDRYASIFLV
ncbi:hypothetical protein VNO77_19058 [Canavalia gladiata]|uniref:Uncharacterized protein n=1 Tax=Canavalia gladiata TaxID=3824 RepID=A0AAN9QP93_CANGL